MAIEAYIYFNGNCREAVEFYAQVFRTDKPQIMTYGDAPPNPEFALSEEAKNLVLHSQLNISDSNIMFSDVYPSMPFVIGNNISLTIVSADIDEIKSSFNKLKEGGRVEMDLQKTFWSKLYGNLIDKYGINWQFSYRS